MGIWQQRKQQQTHQKLYDDVALAISQVHDNIAVLIHAHEKQTVAEVAIHTQAAVRYNRVAEEYHSEHATVMKQYRAFCEDGMCKMLRYGDPAQQINEIEALAQPIKFTCYHDGSSGDRGQTHTIDQAPDVGTFKLPTLHGCTYAHDDYEGTYVVGRTQKGLFNEYTMDKYTVQLKPSAYARELKQLKTFVCALEIAGALNDIVATLDTIRLLNIHIIDVTETAQTLVRMLENEELDEIEELDVLYEEAQSLLANRFTL